jgi:hypothetical protein
MKRWERKQIVMNGMLIYEVMELEWKKERRNCKPFMGKQKKY